jgi:hypothetical protein
VAEFLVELHLPRRACSSVAAANARAGAEALTREGTPVRHLRTIFIPDDEVCFHLFEAASADVVEEAARRARITFERVLPAVSSGSRPVPS